jgi:hypothetical protein
MRFSILTILLLLFIIGITNGQNSSNSTGGRMDNETGDGQSKGDDESKEKEDIYVPSKIRIWKLEDQFSSIRPLVFDTATYNFHNYNPIFKKSISNNYLGYLGAPYESNLFFDRTKKSDYYFLQNSDAYRRTSSDVEYFNTTTPYSNLMYTQGSQGTGRYEQTFSAFFTQNIDSTTNIGFRFNTLKNESEYIYLESLHKYLTFFASRNSERYNGYFSIINSNDNLVNNGGIVDETIDTYIDSYSLSVNLDDEVETTCVTKSIFTSHELLFGEIPFLMKQEVDSLETRFVPKYSIQYSIDLNNYKRQFIEETVDEEFFENIYMDSTSHTDSSSFTRFSQILQLKAFEDERRKFTFGKRVFLENEIVNAKHPLAYGERTYKYSNLYLGGEIFKSQSSFWTWKALAKFGFLGRNIGDAIVKGSLEKPIVFGNDTTSFFVEGWYQDQSPDIFQSHWKSNHYEWENDFNKQHEVVVRGNYHYPRFRLGVGLNYELLSNYFYHNEQALPDQFNDEFSVLSAWLNKDFVVGRFGWSNKVAWQAVSNDAVLHLPEWSFYSSIYYSHYLFKVMKIQLGAEAYYHTQFMSNRYEPSTNRFYLQNDQLTGGYPVLNLYANAKLKRTSAFVKMTHVNSLLDFDEFFSVPDYPLEQMAFRFGFFWTFYD